jgi:hypothetical protein
VSHFGVEFATREQIRIGSEQNIFSNYYKHLEEFVKHCEHISKDHAYTVANKYKLHHSLFPRAKEIDGGYEISPVYRHATEKIANHIFLHLEKLSIERRECQEVVISSIIDLVDAAKNLHYLEINKSENKLSFYLDKNGAFFDEGDFGLLMKDIVDVFNLIATIYIFEDDLEKFKNLDIIRRINFKRMPKIMPKDSDLIIQPFDINDVLDPPVDPRALAKEIAPNL